MQMLFWYGGKLHWKCAQMEKYDITYTNTKIEIIIRKPQTVSLNGGGLSLLLLYYLRIVVPRKNSGQTHLLSLFENQFYILFVGRTREDLLFFKEKQTDVVWEGQVIFLKLVWWYCGVWWPVDVLSCVLQKISSNISGRMCKLWQG